MSTIPEIEAAVSNLSPEELSQFRKWFQDFDAEAWDQQFERDVRAGRLERLADDARKELREGRCKDL